MPNNSQPAKFDWVAVRLALFALAIGIVGIAASIAQQGPPVAVQGGVAVAPALIFGVAGTLGGIYGVCRQGYLALMKRF